jgi:hypothetical protein
MRQLPVVLAGVYSYTCSWRQLQLKQLLKHAFENWI